MAALVSCQADQDAEEKDFDGVPADVGAAVEKTPTAEVLGMSDDGLPTHIAGDLGRSPASMDARVAESAMRSQLTTIAPMFRLTPEELRFSSMHTDELGYRHIRYQQRMNGLEVVGGELDLHIDHRQVTYLANGSAKGFKIPATPSITVEQAKASLGGNSLYGGLTLGASRLVYLISSVDRTPHLAWEIAAEGEREGNPANDLIFVDAHSGELADVHPRIHTSLNRNTYNLNHGTSLPGTLARSEGQGPNADVDVNAAHDYAGDTYNCYKLLFGRDSYDNAGAQLKSSVHYSSNYVNAFWNGTQMVYGDGDGTTASSLARSFDVIAHELTHAVTEKESGLVYANESGALNESNSDLFSAICEAWKAGIDGSFPATSDVWKIGETVWTPGTPGDALRYMDSPTKDGSSKDYYPERYTGGSDNGGVHWNSGIGNLAFYMAVNGGKHPRDKTPTITVTGVGMKKAANIWYRAATEYYQSTTNFSQARAAVVQAATDLHGAGSAEVKSMEDAWGAVGVGPPIPDPATVALTKDVAITGVSGPPNRTYSLDVPAGATTVTFSLNANNGDADLYGKFGSKPTTTDNEAKSETETSVESITINTAGRAGKYYILVNAFGTYNNLTVLGTHNGTGGGDPPPTGDLQNGVPKTGLSGAKDSKTRYTFIVPSGATRVTFNTSGGSGDCDLYVSKGVRPDTGTGQWQYRSIGSTNSESIDVATGDVVGTWNVLMSGWSAYQANSITAKYYTSTGGPVTKTWTGLAATYSPTAPFKTFTFDVRANASQLKFDIKGGTGDADMYIRFGAPPTKTAYDCRPYIDGNTEACNMATARQGTYYIGLFPYSTYSGVTLTASHQ